MIQLSFLGAMGCVGASGVLVDTGSEKVLLDYGTKITEKPQVFPLPVGKVDALLLSHSHLDHCGALPLVAREAKVYARKVSMPLAELLLLDTIKISHEEGISLPYTREDLSLALSNFEYVEYKQEFQIHSLRVKTFPAGHIPGSCMFLLETKGKRILYTGDFNLSETRLMQAASLDVDEVDCLIIESTYSDREHPERRLQEKELMKVIRETLAQDGVVIIPVFAVSRAQEILLVLHRYKIDYPLYLDGMAKKATTIVLREADFKAPEKLQEVLEKVEFLSSAGERKKAVRRPCVIVTTSGMLSGGPTHWYLQKLHARKNCSLALVGYQLDGTPGKLLLETGKYVKDELVLDVKMRVRRLDFSSHAGKSQLFRLVEKVSPEKIFCVHGDHTQEFALELREKGFDAVAPLATNRIFSI